MFHASLDLCFRRRTLDSIASLTMVLAVLMLAIDPCKLMTTYKIKYISTITVVVVNTTTPVVDA